MSAAPTLFVADLHLSAVRPEIIELFQVFLRNRAEGAAALYILGDLFEYWVGDDALEQAEHAEVAAALRRLTGAGVPVYLMHGNRDFLLGERFARATGARILDTPARLRLHGHETLLLHGDSLCTDDVEHQAWRRQVLQKDWQERFLAMSFAERTRIATELRRQSEARKRRKSMAMMDVNPAAVQALMRAHGATRLIHGHTHRPGRHRVELDGGAAERIVLGDWYAQGSVLECTPEGWRLLVLPVPAARRQVTGNR